MPELGLSFFVLANTDNLTTPFPSIGDGDIMKSTLALTFFRHFVFPLQHGAALPEIDWSAGEAELLEQLAAVEDPVARIFLERELWSFRQAFASSGQVKQAGTLAKVNAQAYPQSEFRQDRNFTGTVGKFPVVPRSIRPADFVWLNLGVGVWLLLVVLSMIWLAWRLYRQRISPLFGLLWLLAGLFLGPVAVLSQALLERGRLGSASVSQRGQILGAAIFSLAGYMLGWVLAINLLIRAQTAVHPLLILLVTYLPPFILGLLLVRGPLNQRASQQGLGRSIRVGLLAEVIQWNLVYGVMFGLTMLIFERWLSFTPSWSNPIFWFMNALIGAGSLVVLILLNHLQDRRGFTIWPEASGVLVLPSMRNSWWLLLLAVGLAIAALALTIVMLG